MELVAYQQFRDLEESHWWFLGRRSIFLRLLEERPGYRPRPGMVLDLGCGAGEMLEPLERFGPVVGIDASDVAVGFCRDRGASRVLGGDAMRLPVRDASTQLVALVDTIEHLPDDERALAEAHRVLAPGGTVLVTVPAFNFLYSDNDRVAHHLRRYTAGELAGKMRAAGFEHVWTTYYNAFLFPAIVPFLMLVKLKQRLFPRAAGTERTNLHLAFPGIVHRTLFALMDLEGRIARRVRLPLGHSIVALGVRASGT